MARIPDAIERTIPTSSRNVVNIRPASYAGTQALAQGLDTAGDLAARSIENKRRAKADFETSFAANELLKSHLSLMDSFDESEEYEKFVPTYQEKMNKAKTDAASLITDDFAREKFFLQADELVIKGSSDAHTKSLGKEKDVNRGKLQSVLDSARLNISGDEATNAANIRNVQKAIQSARDAGYVDPEAAEKLKSDWAEEYAISSIQMLPADQRIAALEGKGARSDTLTFIPKDKQAALMSQAEAEHRSKTVEARQLQKDAHDQLFLEAYNATRNGGTVPVDVLQKLTPGEQETVFKAKEPRTNPQTRDYLQAMRANDEEKFKRENITGSEYYRKSLSYEELQGFVNDQVSLRSKDAAKQAEVRAKIGYDEQFNDVRDAQLRGALGFTLGSAKSDDDKNTAFNYNRAFGFEVTKQEGVLGRKLNSQEMYEIAHHLVREVVLEPGFFNDTEGYGFDVTNRYSMIPADQRLGYEETLAEQGLAPTQENVVEMAKRGGFKFDE